MHNLVLFSDVVLVLSQNCVKHRSHGVEQVRVRNGAVLEESHEDVAHDEEIQQQDQQEVRRGCHHTVDCHDDVRVRFNHQDEEADSRPGTEVDGKHSVTYVGFSVFIGDVCDV